jgi:hypothetical protein
MAAVRRLWIIAYLVMASAVFAGARVAPPTLPDFDASGGLRIGKPAVAPVVVSGMRTATLASARDGNHVTINLRAGTPRTMWSARPLTAPSKDAPADVARRFFRENSQMWRISGAERDFVVSAEVRDRHTGVTHVYMNQMLGGVPVFPAVVGVHLNNHNQVTAVQGDIFPQTAFAWQASVGPLRAAKLAGTYAGMTLEPVEERSTKGEVTINAAGLRSAMKVTRTVYAVSNPPRAAYRMLVEKNGLEWYDIIVDANTGELLHRRNLYQYAGTLSPSAANVEAAPAAPRALVYAEHPLATVRGTGDRARNYPFTTDPTGKQRGFANSPLYGADSVTTTGSTAGAVTAQTVLALPSAASPRRSTTMALSTSPQSPRGWFTPIGGTYYTYGNNVDAKDDHAADDETTVGMRANGGSNGDFTGPTFIYKNHYGTNGPYAAEPPESGASAERKAGAAPDLPAAVTQLFYTINWYHDILYHLGFNEASGNFQNDNFGKGGLGEDAVYADAQDGSGTNNANFGTPPDGSRPRMQMFLWSSPERDGDLDFDIVIHEYTHGVSNRLVGGPNNTSCLGVGLTGEAGGMGEGWGDWFAAVLSDEPAVAEYSYGDGENGLRLHAYNSYSSAYTYGVLCTGDPLDPNPLGCEVHGAGEFWAALLWEMRESMINRYHNRISPVQFPTYVGKGAGGNIRNAEGRTFDGSGNPAQTDHQTIENASFASMFRVIDAMKFSPCNPTMVDMREAILQADRALGGEFQDVIWRSFANRGLGAGAASLGGGDVPVTVEDFTVPASVTACENAGGPLPAPQFTATPGTNSVTITITPNGAGEYVIERGTVGPGTPVDPTPFVEVGRTFGTTFVDSGVDGGLTFYYRVRALRNTECVSAANVVSVIPSGAALECTVPPTFAGIENAVDAGNCSDVRLDWGSATSSCPAAPGVTYAIYRSTDASFAPSSSTKIASGIVGNSYIDRPGQENTVFYYVVRAEDTTTGHGGPNNGGNVDANLVRRAAMITSGVLISEGFIEDVESGPSTSASNSFTSSSPIILIPERGGFFRDSNPDPVVPHSGSTVWHTYNPDSPAVSPSDTTAFELRSQPMTITPRSILSFFHTFATEAGFDGGVVEWAPVTNGLVGTFSDLGSLIYEGGYNSTMSSQSLGVLNTSPLNYRAGYSGGKLDTMSRVRANVGALVPAGATSRQIVIRFLFGADVANAAEPTLPGNFMRGWYIDDISLDQSCCPASAAPQRLKAKNTKSGHISLSWGAPKNAGAIDRYLIYRETVGTTMPTTFDEQIAEVAGNVTEYVDMTVQFGQSYAYVVRAVPAGGCPSLPSNSVTRAAAVPCSTAPAFGGVQSVSSSPTSTCTLTLSWNAATASCPGATVRYNVYRSTDPAFSPSAATLVASGLTTTSHTDTRGLLSGATYTYIVRAEDSTDSGSGPANSGNEDTNTKRLSGTPAGALTAAPDFSDDLEPGAEPGYTKFSTRVTGWNVLPDPTAHSLTNSWFAPDDQPGAPTLTRNDSFLTLPAMNLTSASTLSFWHNFDFARRPATLGTLSYHSGAVIELSADGVNWVDLGAFITTGGYNGAVLGTAESSLAGRTAWVGSSDGDMNPGRIDAMKPVVVNLGAALAQRFGGATALPAAKIRFRLGGTFQIITGGIDGVGWGVDDIKVTGLQAPGACSTGL